MPTFNRAADTGETDLGWGVARVSAVDRYGRPTTLAVRCKGCPARHDFDVTEGSVLSRFPHVTGCRVLGQVQQHTRMELERRGRGRQV